MQATIVSIPTREITDWDSFHTVFQKVMGFPDFYGRNMNAWDDCMLSLDDPTSGMTTITVGPGETLILGIDDAADFRRRCPEQFAALVECTAFVNYARIDVGRAPILALMLSGHFSTNEG